MKKKILIYPLQLLCIGYGVTLNESLRIRKLKSLNKTTTKRQAIV